MKHALLSVFFYANLAVVLVIGCYRVYLIATAPAADALLGIKTLGD